MPQSSTRRTFRARLSRFLIDVQALFTRRRVHAHGVLFQYFPHQTPAEELVNALLHGVAALASLAGGAWLVQHAARQGGPFMVMGCAAYAISLTAVFTMSTLSHWLDPPRLRGLFRTLDQAAIYLLIAGSCTPHIIRFLFPAGWHWMLAAVWGVALVCAWNKLRGDRVNSISVVSYVLLGWFPMLAVQPLLTAMPAGCLTLVIASGAGYMLGVVFLVWDERVRYFHALWHLFVVAASACNFAAIAIYVV